MPHLDTTTYLHRISTFWFSLIILTLWRTKIHYITHKRNKITALIKEKEL